MNILAGVLLAVTGIPIILSWFVCTVMPIFSESCPEDGPSIAVTCIALLMWLFPASAYLDSVIL